MAIPLHATAWDATGRLLDNILFDWTTADTTIATVDLSGVVRTVGLGAVNILASSGKTAGRITVQVLPEGVQSLSITAPYSVLPDDEFTQDLTFAAGDALGNTISDATVSWTSTDVAVLSVDAQGTIRTHTSGRATVWARSAGAEASQSFEVVPVTGHGRASVDVKILELLRQMGPSGLSRAPTGISAALVRDGRLVMARGYGYTGVGAAEPVEPTSLFRIASISKPLTAVATMQLIEAGLLDLDDKLVDVATNIIPDEGIADPRAADITLRHLLEHKGGWDVNVAPNPFFILRQVAADMSVSSPPSRQAFGKWIFRHALHFAPGTRYTYNNVNYVMLGEVIESVTGKAYEDYVRDEVLEPIGITRMRVGGTLVSDRAEGEVAYHFGGASTSVFDEISGSLPDQYGGRFNLEMIGSSGGWIASAVDLVRFGLAAANPPVLVSAATHEYMTTDHSGSGVYGAGWVIDADGFNHSGLLEGSNSILSIRPDGGIVAILFNGNITIPFASFLDPVLAETGWPDDDLFDEY